MSELNETEISRLMPPFLAAFNERSGTGFEMKDSREPIDGSADMHFVHPAYGELKVQWTTPPLDAPEKRAVTELHRFGGDIVAALTEAQLHGVIFGMSLHALPTRRSERLQVLAAVVRLVQQIRDEHGGGYSHTTLPDWKLSRYRLGLEKYFSEIDVVANINPNAKPFLFGGPDIASLVPHASARAASALEHKAERYGPAARDLVLVIHFDMDTYDADDIEFVRRALQDRTDEFKQVWIVRDPAIASPTAHWVKGGFRSVDPS